MIKKLISAALAASCLSSCVVSSCTQAKVFTRTSSDVSFPQYSIELNAKELNTFKNEYVPNSCICKNFYNNQLASCESSSAKATDKCIAKKLLDIAERDLKDALEELKQENQCPGTSNSKRTKIIKKAFEYAKEKGYDPSAIFNSDIRVKLEDLHGKGWGYSSNFPPYDICTDFKPICWDDGSSKRTLKHELTHQYMKENLFYHPIWIAEGFATQQDTDEKGYTDKEEVLKRYDFSKNFALIHRFPAEEIKDAYKFNFLFIKEWLKIPGNSLNKLIDEVGNNPKLTYDWDGKSGIRNNKIYYDYIMNTGGKEILKKFEEIKQQNTNNPVTETTEKQTNNPTSKTTNLIIGLFVALLTLFDLYRTLFG